MEKPLILPHLPAEKILAFYRNAPGNEIESGKFANPESSSALAANAFGLFVESPQLWRLPGSEVGASAVALEVTQRFPWAGGRHPCLDAWAEMETGIVGVESKRYEPYRAHGKASMSEAYWRDVWGGRMTGFCRIRDRIRDAQDAFERLDAAQLVKHAFGLRTESARRGSSATLYYIYAEPSTWADGRPVDRALVQRHREEVMRFAEVVEGDEVLFRAASYRTVVEDWSGVPEIRHHAEAVLEAFDV